MSLAVDLPVPRDWQVFEDFCRDLFAAEWRDPHTKKNGRPGQKQDGVDVYGRKDGALQAVQCKKRQVFPERTLTEAEVRAEVDAAKDFDDDLQTLIIATTAPPDTKIQKLARDLTKENKLQKTGHFRVEVYGWSDLCERLRRHSDENRRWQRALMGWDGDEEDSEAVRGSRSQDEAADGSPSIAEQRRAALIADLKDLLETPPGPAAQAIARRRPAWSAILATSGSLGLVDELVEATDIPDVLTELDGAHQELHRLGGTDRLAAGTIEEVVWRLAPLLVQQGFLHSLPNEAAGALLQLPVATYTIAELAVAAFDGGPSLLRPRDPEFPDGFGRLGEWAEDGIDPGSKDMLLSFTSHLEKNYLTAEDRKLLNRKRKNPEKGEELARDDIFQLVDDLFLNDAQGQERPRRNYLLYDNDFAREQHDFLEVVREKLKSIHLVEMTGLELVSERKICHPLRNILSRCARSAEEKRKP